MTRPLPVVGRGYELVREEEGAITDEAWAMVVAWDAPQAVATLVWFPFDPVLQRYAAEGELVLLRVTADGTWQLQDWAEIRPPQEEGLTDDPDAWRAP